MARYSSRSRSFSPRRFSRSPPRRPYYDEQEDRRRSGRDFRDRGPSGPSGPTGLLIRNLPLDARPEDLRIPFERFGPVKDVYLPKNYYTGEPRGFGFVKFRNPDDAIEAKEYMNHKVIGGREIRIVFAEENRKTPQEMRTTSRVRSTGGRRLSPMRSPRRQFRSHSHSPPPSGHDPRRRGRDGEDYYYSPQRSPLRSFNDREYRPPRRSLVRERISRSPLSPR